MTRIALVHPEIAIKLISTALRKASVGGKLTNANANAKTI